MDDPTIQPQPAQSGFAANPAPAMPAVIEDPTTQSTDPVQAQLAEMSARVDELERLIKTFDRNVGREVDLHDTRLTAIELWWRSTLDMQAPKPAPIVPPAVQAEAAADEPAQPQAETEQPATPAADGSIPVGTKLNW